MRAQSYPCLKTWQYRLQMTDFFWWSISHPSVSIFSKSLQYLKCRCQGTKTSCSLNFFLLTLSWPCHSCSNAQTQISPSPPSLVIRVSSSMALWRMDQLEKWWMTAMEMKASQDWERRGRYRLSAAKSWQSQDFYCAVLRRPIERSVPTMKRFLLTPKYLPFPQPTSKTNDASGSSLRKAQILGQGLYLVCEKCGAILSQTSQTCFFSISVGMLHSESATLFNFSSNVFTCFSFSCGTSSSGSFSMIKEIVKNADNINEGQLRQ